MIHFWCYCHIKFCFHLQPQKVFLFMIVKAVHKQSSFIVSQEFVGKEEKSSRHLLRCYKGLFIRQLQKSISLFLSNNLLLWQPNQTNIVLSNWLSDGMPFKRHSRREMFLFLCASSLSYNFTFRYHSEVIYKLTHLVNPSALHLIVSPIIFWCFPPDPASLWVLLSLFLVHNLSKYPFLCVMDEWNYQFCWSESSSLDKFGSLCTFQIYRTRCTDRDRGFAVELIIFSTLVGCAVMSARCSSRWGLVTTNVRSET